MAEFGNNSIFFWFCYELGILQYSWVNFLHEYLRYSSSLKPYSIYLQLDKNLQEHCNILKLLLLFLTWPFSFTTSYMEVCTLWIWPVCTKACSHPSPDLVQSVNLIDKVIETGKLAFLQEW